MMFVKKLKIKKIYDSKIYVWSSQNFSIFFDEFKLFYRWSEVIRSQDIISLYLRKKIIQLKDLDIKKMYKNYRENSIIKREDD